MMRALGAFVVLLIGCSDDNVYMKPSILFTDNKNLEEEYIKGVELESAIDSVVSPFSMICWEDKLVISEMGFNGIFHTLDLNTDEYEELFGTKGKERGELLFPSSLNIGDNGELQVYDPNSIKMLSYQYVNEENKYILDEEYKFENLQGVPNLFKVKNEILTTSTLNADYRLYVYDLNGDYKRSLGKLPITNESQPSRVLAEACYAWPRYYNGILVFGYYIAPFIQILNIETGDWFLIKGPEDFDFEYQIVPVPDSPYAVSEETRVGYIDVQISDNFIYALYNGRYQKDDGEFNVNTVYVFGRDGKPVKKLILDEGIIRFAVYKDNYIYGIKDGEEFRLYKYEI